MTEQNNHPLITLLEVALKLEESGKLDRALIAFDRIAKHPVTPTIKGLGDTANKALERISKAMDAQVAPETPKPKEPTPEEAPPKKVHVEEILANEEGIPKNLLFMAKVEDLKIIPEVADAMPVTQEEYDQLKESISKRGIQTPLILNTYGEVVCGNTRLKIAYELGLKTVPAMALNIPKAHILEYAIRDNVERRQLTYQQKLMALSLIETKKGAGKRRATDNSPTIEEASETTGASKSSIAKSRMYQKRIEEDPDLKDKPVHEVLYGAPKVKKKESLSYTIGEDDTNIETKVISLVQELLDVDTEIGDRVRITINLQVKEGKKGKKK